MQATFDDTDGDVRLYFGRNGSIVSYFVPAGTGSELHIEAGFLTYPWEFDNQHQAVRVCVCLKKRHSGSGFRSLTFLLCPSRDSKQSMTRNCPKSTGRCSGGDRARFEVDIPKLAMSVLGQKRTSASRLAGVEGLDGCYNIRFHRDLLLGAPNGSRPHSTLSQLG